jgi:transposase
MLIVEVDRPDRRARRAHGKSDPLDAYSAARAALFGAASVVPKLRHSRVEAIRGVSGGTIQCRQSPKSGHASNQILDRHRPGAAARAAAAPAHPEDDCGLRPTPPRTPTRRHRTRHQDRATPTRPSPSTALGGDRRSRPRALSTGAPGRPALLALPGVGPEVAGQVLISAGDNFDRIKSEAAFAHLCGAAPIPASSGRTHRHRLNRGGDRGANNALYVVVPGRLRYDPRTRAYAERRTHEGLSKPEIIRCLKRYVAREMFNALPKPVPENSSAHPLARP